MLQYRPYCQVNKIIDYYLSEEDELYVGADGASQKTALLAEQNRVYNIHEDLLITPTPDCKLLLRDHQLLFKKQQNGFWIIGKIQIQDNKEVPYCPMDSPFKLRFSIQLKNKLFTNFTNVLIGRQQSSIEQYIYYFSNKANNVITQDKNGDDLPNDAITRYLSLPITGYITNKVYEPGELIFASDNLWEAVQQTNSSPTIAPGHWRNIFTAHPVLLQFANTLDRRILKPPYFRYDVSTANQESLVFIVKDLDGLIVKTITHYTSEIGTNLSYCDIDLSNLEPGAYQFETTDINGNDIVGLPALPIYLETQFFSQTPFAIIELHHEPGDIFGVDTNGLMKVMTMRF